MRLFDNISKLSGGKEDSQSFFVQEYSSLSVSCNGQTKKISRFPSCFRFSPSLQTAVEHRPTVRQQAPGMPFVSFTMDFQSLEVSTAKRHGPSWIFTHLLSSGYLHFLFPFFQDHSVPSARRSPRRFASGGGLARYANIDHCVTLVVQLMMQAWLEIFF